MWNGIRFPFQFRPQVAIHIQCQETITFIRKGFSSHTLNLLKFQTLYSILFGLNFAITSFSLRKKKMAKKCSTNNLTRYFMATVGNSSYTNESVHNRWHCQIYLGDYFFLIILVPCNVIYNFVNFGIGFELLHCVLYWRFFSSGFLAVLSVLLN